MSEVDDAIRMFRSVHWSNADLARKAHDELAALRARPTPDQVAAMVDAELERILREWCTSGFNGWWSDDEKKDCPEPWERFRIILQGEEAGDVADTDEAARILSAAIRAREGEGKK